MKRTGGLLLSLTILVFSCVAGPEPVIPEDHTEQPAPKEPAKEGPPPDPIEEKILPTEEPLPREPAPLPTAAEEVVFDPGSISEEIYKITKADIQGLVRELNSIIRARNYTAWLGYLSENYLEVINSKSFLEEKTEDLYRRDQIIASSTGRDPRSVAKRVLRSPRDYFENVVVPSRANDRVDDIAYISETNVRAYTMDTRGNRLILYDLEHINSKWKIIN
jgi:hypothetical protein